MITEQQTVLAPSEKFTITIERYENIGVLENVECRGIYRDADVSVVYQKRVDKLKRMPVRETFKFESSQLPDFFDGGSDYGGYVKYTSEDGSVERRLLLPNGTERNPYLGQDPREWREDLASLVKKLPCHVVNVIDHKGFFDKS